jgi:hypothetical protein
VGKEAGIGMVDVTLGMMAGHEHRKDALAGRTAAKAPAGKIEWSYNNGVVLVALHETWWQL